MASLLHTLREHEKQILPIIAQAWELEIDDPDDEGLPKALERLMTDPGRMRAVLDALHDRERSALQFLLNQGRRGTSPAGNFTLVYGEPRKLGAAQLARERPLTNPANVTEALLFRGLIGFGFETGEQGARRIVFIPDELVGLISSASGYKTVYDDEEEFDESLLDDDDESADEPPPAAKPAAKVEPPPPPPKAAPAKPAPAKTAPSAPPPAAAAPPPTHIAVLEGIKADSVRPADTTLVDDLTTILAAISRYEQSAEVNAFAHITADAFAQHLLVPAQERVIFLLSIAMAMNLIRYADGRLEINRLDQSRALPRWLSAQRPEQIRLLAEAWRTTDLYVDLARVPSLRVDTQAGTTDFFPTAARKNVLGQMAAKLPDDGWWSVDQFIALMAGTQPDFQRPNGAYDAWYIFDAATGEPLTGAGSWERVDGALLRFYVELPLHWLGMIDLAEAGGRPAARLNAYGRAFIKGGAFPKPPDPPEKIVIEADGRIVVGRRVSRADRYQVARFTSWAGVGSSGYSYQLDADGVAVARQQGITLDQMETFLKNVSGGLPEPVAAFLTTWRHGAAASVTFERVTILRVTSDDLLDALWDDPTTRRYFGARLGPTAVIIRADQTGALREALGQRGIAVDIIGE